MNKSFGKNLHKAMKSLDLTPTMLSRRSGITVEQLYNIIHQGQEPTVWTIQRILATTPITYEELAGVPLMIVDRLDRPKITSSIGTPKPLA